MTFPSVANWLFRLFSVCSAAVPESRESREISRRFGPREERRKTLPAKRIRPERAECDLGAPQKQTKNIPSFDEKINFKENISKGNIYSMPTTNSALPTLSRPGCFEARQTIFCGKISLSELHDIGRKSLAFGFRLSRAPLADLASVGSMPGSSDD